MTDVTWRQTGLPRSDTQAVYGISVLPACRLSGVSSSRTRVARAMSEGGGASRESDAAGVDGAGAGAGLERAAAGDPATAAFQRLFETYAEALRRYAVRFVQSRASAEDLVQDAYWGLWRVWPQLAPDTNVRAYLYASVRNHALNHLRRQRAEDRSLAYVTPPPFHEGPVLPSDGESQVAADEITAAVERVVAAMPRRQREIAALRLRDQLSTADIAARLGISPRTVETHIARITRTLRDQLPLLLR